MKWWREVLAVVAAVVVAVPLLGAGIGWGLPSGEADSVLFGGRKAWTGAEVVALAGGWGGGEKDGKGADVDRDPLDRAGWVELNDTDVKRAEIVRRWRLYTWQPDEMINLRAMGRMRPGEGKFDPGMYQYGGVWFYPAGVALKVAEKVGYVQLKADAGWYMDRPGEVGRLYVVFRGMSVGWGVVGVLAVYVLSRQMGVGAGLAVVVGVGFATMPGVVVFVREAKPHVGGVALVLWAAVLGVEYVRRGRWGWLVGCAAVGGLAFGMVVSMLPAVLVGAGAVVGRGVGGGRLRIADFGLRIGGVVGVFLLVYGVTNPYVVMHLVGDRGVLFSQVGNSTAMYGGGSLKGMVLTGFGLLVLMSPGVVLLLPVVGAVLEGRKRGVGMPGVVWVLGPVVVGVLVMFVGLAANAGGGKPGEYARFGLLVGAGGVVGAGYLATRFRRAWALPVTVVVFHVLMSGEEIARYVEDAGAWGRTSRGEAAVRLRESGVGAVALTAEPAPFNTPAVDLWGVKMVLAPRGVKVGEGGLPEGVGAWLVQPPGGDGYWRMSWAGRGFRLAR